MEISPQGPGWKAHSLVILQEILVGLFFHQKEKRKETLAFWPIYKNRPSACDGKMNKRNDDANVDPIRAGGNHRLIRKSKELRNLSLMIHFYDRRRGRKG